MTAAKAFAVNHNRESGEWYITDPEHGLLIATLEHRGPETERQAYAMAASKQLKAAAEDIAEWADGTFGPCDEGCDCGVDALHAAILAATPLNDPEDEE